MDNTIVSSLTLPADAGRLDEVLSFIEEILEKNDSPMPVTTQVLIAAEEIFVNICHYAYTPGTGEAAITCEIEDSVPKRAVISFIDGGVRYNPLEKPDPDVTLGAEERQVGGLGIFMVKRTMDEVQYEYKDGKNILRLYKFLTAPSRKARGTV